MEIGSTVQEPDVRDNAFAMLLLRAAIPPGPRVPSIDSHLAWAGLCAAAGLVEPARMLYAIGFIRQGFSVQHRAARTLVARDFGWDELAGADTAERRAGGPVDIAIAEIEELARHLGVRIAAPGLAGARGPARRPAPTAASVQSVMSNSTTHGAAGSCGVPTQ